MPDILHLSANPDMTGLAYINWDIPYTAEGQKCAILTPWNNDPAKLYPAIVFIQGSAWATPDIHYEILQLGRYAQAGYVVMTISHRSRKDGHPFPAFLQDTKCAIRYLRAHAETYHIDPERIAVWGTSSGGNTAMLVQLTGDDSAYRTAEYPEQSDTVRCAVECFGPADMVSICEEHADHIDMIDQLRGSMAPMDCARAMSPFHQITDGTAYPPILMLHGSGDPVVDYETQCLPMYKRYLDTGVDVRLICVDGAPHEGPFWSAAVHDHILAFLDEQLKA